MNRKGAKTGGSMTLKATKIPWSFHREGKCIADNEDLEICTFNYIGYDGEDEANAKLIVKAVNHFEELVSALTFLKSIRSKCHIPNDQFNKDGNDFDAVLEAVLKKVA